MSVVAADDGSPDPRLAAAVTGDDGSPVARGELLAALAGARVFLAIAAQALGTAPAAGTGLPAERAARMSLLSLGSASGRRALPAFLDGTQVQRWRPEARPVPTPGPLACRAVIDDGAAALLLDPLGAAIALSGAALEELAAGRVPVPGSALSSRYAAVDLQEGPPPPPGLLQALTRALAPEDLEAARLVNGADGPVLAVTPRRPLLPAELAGLAARVRERLGDDLPPAGLDLAALRAGNVGTPVPLRRRGLLRRLR